MKTIQSRVAILGLTGMVVAASWLTAKHAFAGRTETKNLFMDDALRYAEGSLADVRASAGAVAHIGLDVQMSQGGGQVVVAIAKSPGGAQRMCTSNDPRMADVAIGANGDSYVQFGWNDAGECRYIWVGNSSRYRPKGL